MSEGNGRKLFKNQQSSHSRRRSRSTENTDLYSRDEGPSYGVSEDVQRYDLISPASRDSEVNSTSSHQEKNDSSGKGAESVSTSSGPSKSLECAICLQLCVHPARLPCSHVFCFLCLKGIARGAQTCAMCRAPIPSDYTDNPELVPIPGEIKEEAGTSEKYTWFYEGRNGSGWWQYDERTSAELEQCFLRGQTKTEVLIVGYLYTVDLQEMMQARKNEPARRRAIKRDLVTCPKKGIAGLRQPALSGLTDALSKLDIRSD